MRRFRFGSNTTDNARLALKLGAFDHAEEKEAGVNPVRIGDATLYCGDCLEILPTLPKVDAVVTDPPYSSGGYNESGKSSGSIGTTINSKIQGDTMSTAGYSELIRRVMRGANATAAYVFTDWRMWGHTAVALELSGFRVRGMLVWDKGWAGMGMRWKMQHELICWGTKLTAKPGDGMGNVLSCPRSGNEFHPTEKPLALVEKIVKNAEPGVVFDPFMGSGTSGVAAVRAGRGFVGIELDPRHFDIACKRIEAAYAQGRLFEPEAPEPQQGSLVA